MKSLALKLGNFPSKPCISECQAIVTRLVFIRFTVTTLNRFEHYVENAGLLPAVTSKSISHLLTPLPDQQILKQAVEQLTVDWN